MFKFIKAGISSLVSFVKKDNSKKDSSNALAIFKKVKEQAAELNDKNLSKAVAFAEDAVKKFARAGQHRAIQTTLFQMDIVKKEYDLLDKGYTKYIERKELEDIIVSHPTRVLYAVDAADYTRELPEHALKAIEDTSDILDGYFIVYTDHSRRAVRRTEKVRDPILFGVISGDIEYKTGGGKTITETVTSERVYMLADWTDDLCDLTFQSLIKEASGKIESKDLSTDRATLFQRIDKLRKDAPGIVEMKGED